MSNKITSIELLEDGKLLAYCDKERIYIQPTIVVDTFVETSVLQLHGRYTKRVTIDTTIKEIDGVPFSGDFEALETEIRGLARMANSVNNTKTHGKKFTISTKFVPLELPVAKTEYMVYVFRVKQGNVKVNIKGVSVNVLSTSNDHFLLITSFDKKFDYPFVGSDFNDISPASKLEVAIPGVGLVPVNPIQDGFLNIEGRDLKSRFGVSKDEVEAIDTSPTELVEGVIYVVTAMGETASAKLDFAFNWEEC
jgi:hypothetical protein